MWALRLRCFALLGAPALALHELRYLIAYGDDAGRALDEQGHGYLGTVAVLVALAVVASLATLVAALVRGGGPAARARSWRVRWPAASGALLVVYTAQELAEGMLASGHREGLAGVAGRGPRRRRRSAVARRRGCPRALRRCSARAPPASAANGTPARTAGGATATSGRPRPPRRRPGATPPRSLTGPARRAGDHATEGGIHESERTHRRARRRRCRHRRGAGHRPRHQRRQ